MGETLGCGEKSGQLPADPLTTGATHDPILVLAREPVELLGEERHRLPPWTGQPRPVRAPEHALRTKRIVYTADVRVEVRKRIRHHRMAWQRRGFHRDIGIARQAAHVRKFDERKVAARVDAEGKVIDDEPQAGMACGNLFDLPNRGWC